MANGFSARSRLKRARLSQGLSQAELAAKIDVSQAAVSNWELGNTEPRSSQRQKLERVLGSLNQSSQADDTPISSGSAFGSWLSKTRANAGMSVPELAEASGVSAVAIYNIESGRSVNPQTATRDRLEKALQVEVPSEISEEAAEDQGIEGLGTLIDFDPHDYDALPRVGGVYVLYDISERPIYIGKAENIATRVRNHADKFWFKSPIVFSASYVEITSPDMRHKVEQVLIKFLKSNAVINKQSVDR